MAISIKYAHGRSDFYTTLRQRVDAYFEETGRAKNWNALMAIKSLFWAGSCVLLWSLILFGGFSALPTLGMAMLLGFCFAGVGFNIGHDAIHGAYTGNKRADSLLSWAFDLMGANSYTWSIAHNYLHHTYPNVPGVDGDIEPGPMIQLYPHEKRSWAHRFQHIYAFFLYSFTSLVWVFVKDFEQMMQPHPRTDKPHPKEHWPRLIAGKVAHIGLLAVAPVVLLDFPLWQIAVGFIAMHMVGGFTLALVFQLAHVVGLPEFIDADEDGVIHDGWAEHQLRTTADFGGSNPLVTWVCGGLDYQTEHHLFPKICHIHYSKLAPIVKQTAEEFGLPYHENKTFTRACIEHGRALYRLGRGQDEGARRVSHAGDHEQNVAVLPTAQDVAPQAAAGGR
jgi:linoleoyl-CoA desaturase